MYACTKTLSFTRRVNTICRSFEQLNSLSLLLEVKSTWKLYRYMGSGILQFGTNELSSPSYLFIWYNTLSTRFLQKAYKLTHILNKKTLVDTDCVII